MELWQVTGLVVTVMAATVAIVSAVRDYRDPYSSRRLSQTIRQMAHEQALTATRLLEVETLLAEYELGVKQNIRFMEANKLVPLWRPTRTLKRISNGGSRLLPLYTLFYERFSDDELFDLAFRVGIGREDIAGDTHSARAQQLIEYAVRRELIDDLVRVGREVRPELTWPGGLGGG